MQRMATRIRGLAGQGVVTRTELLASGMTRTVLGSMIDTGQIIRLDRSRFALPGTHPRIMAAVKAGGTLTCVSALRQRGVSVLDDEQVHVRRPIRRRRDHALGHGLTECTAPPMWPDHPMDGIDSALWILITNHSDEDVVVALESTMNLRLRTRSELHDGLAAHSKRARRLLARVDGRSESPLESVVRHRLASRGIHTRSQVPIPGLGRVDLLVGRSLIIETDGYEFHADRQAFGEDRRRDRTAVALGYCVVRVTWEQVFRDWPNVLADISAIICARRHRKPPQSAMQCEAQSWPGPGTAGQD